MQRLAPAQWDSLSIAKIRAVGDYTGTDTTFDNTVEVWIASPPALPGGLVCTVNARVYLNASNKHLMGCIPGDKVASVGRAAPHNMI